MTITAEEAQVRSLDIFATTDGKPIFFQVQHITLGCLANNFEPCYQARLFICVLASL